MTAPDLSIVIPMYNEAGNIGELLDEIIAAFAGRPIEIVVVDDQSDDASAAEVEARMAATAALRLLRHKKRSGKSRALRTGFAAARGAWVATLDGDGQNDPRDLARIWAARAGSSETVFIAGVRQKRNDGPVKWVTSRVANAIRKRMLRDDCRDAGCGLKMMPAAFAKSLPYFDNMHRFLPALARRVGLDVIEEDIDDRPRQHGVSKYGFFDRASVALFDLFGVFWLIRRYSDPVEVSEADAPPRVNR